jgi:hypothetical protein
MKLICTLAMTHSPSILQVDTVRAYHSGPRLVVEVDIVMSRTECLQLTHDISEELQIKIESLPDVERAYVHVDYETSHKPVSRSNIVLIFCCERRIAEFCIGTSAQETGVITRVRRQIDDYVHSTCM